MASQPRTVGTHPAVAIAPHARVGVLHVVDGAAAEIPTRGPIEFNWVGISFRISAELSNRLVLTQANLMEVPLLAERPQGIDNSTLQIRHRPRRVALIVEAVHVGAEIRPEPEAPTRIAIGEPRGHVRIEVRPAADAVRVRGLPDPLENLDGRWPGQVERIPLETRDHFVDDARVEERG